MTVLHNRTFRSILHPLSVHIEPHATLCLWQCIKKEDFCLSQTSMEMGSVSFPSVCTDHDVKVTKKPPLKGGKC